tara:strand:- start:326 stop:1009 length:684 start_codon:yes stop_codon:yes gene_type:complete
MGTANGPGGQTVGGPAGAISVWRDISGKQNHMKQATGAKRPSVNVNAQNGKNSITLSEAEFLVCDSASAFDFGAGTFDIYMIFDYPAGAGTKIFFSNAAALNQTGFAMTRLANETIKVRTYNSSGKASAATADLSGKGYIFTRFHRASNNATSIAYDAADGTAATKAISGGSDQDVSGGAFSIGALNGGVGGAGMHAAEILVYNRDLPAAQSAKVKSYLSDKYGLAL